MAALADNAAAVHHHDGVGGLDRTEAMGDDKSCRRGRARSGVVRSALVDQAVDRLLDKVLALGIDLAGGLVEDQ